MRLRTPRPNCLSTRSCRDLQGTTDLRFEFGGIALDDDLLITDVWVKSRGCWAGGRASCRPPAERISLISSSFGFMLFFAAADATLKDIGMPRWGVRYSTETMNQQENALEPVRRSWNWRIWAGFLLALAAIPAYFLLFARYPITRDVPWTTWLMFAVAEWLLWVGVRRAFARTGLYRGKIAGPVLALLSLGAAVFFGYATLYASRQLPSASGSPGVGEKASDFSLPDTSGNMVSMSTLLSEPMPGGDGRKPRALLLVFYRGYW